MAEARSYGCPGLSGSMWCSPIRSLMRMGWRWLWVGGQRVSLAQFAEVLPHLPGLRPGDVVVLASCELARDAAGKHGFTGVGAPGSVCAARRRVR